MTINLDQHTIWMQYALREAEKAYSYNEVPIGAIVVKEDKIIGRGYNQCESLKDPTAHAEMIAITSATNTIKDWRLTESYMYVTKEPCPMCAGAIINARIKLICFGMYDNKEGCCGSIFQLCDEPRFKHQVIVRGGIFKDDCKEIMDRFFKQQRKK